MLSMNHAEIKLRRGSRLYWVRYSFSDRYDMTRELIPVRLLGRVGDSYRHTTEAKTLNYRVIIEGTDRIKIIDGHWLIDPTRIKKP